MADGVYCVCYSVHRSDSGENDTMLALLMPFCDDVQRTAARNVK